MPVKKAWPPSVPIEEAWPPNKAVIKKTFFLPKLTLKPCLDKKKHGFPVSVSRKGVAFVSVSVKWVWPQCQSQ